jgi:hypothetical protein
MSIESVLLTAADEQYAPPAKVVRVALSGPTEEHGALVWLSVEKYEQDATTTNMTVEAKLPPIHLAELLAALLAHEFQQPRVDT